MKRSASSAGLWMLLASRCLGDVAIDSTVVAFELRRSLSGGEDLVEPERLDLTLALPGADWRASATARIPLQADPVRLQIDSGHLGWTFPGERFGGIFFYGENRSMLPQNRLPLVDLSDRRQGMRGVRFETAGGRSGGTTVGAIQLATLPGTGSSTASAWAEHRTARVSHRVAGLRFDDSGAGPEAEGCAAAVWTLSGRTGADRSLWIGELGISSGGGWAAALEARELRVSGGSMGAIVFQPRVEWITPDWRSPMATAEPGETRLAIELRALPFGVRFGLRAQRSSAWHRRPWDGDADHRIEVDAGGPLGVGLDWRLRGSSGRSAERIEVTAVGPRVVELDASTAQHDLLAELSGATQSTWARAQVRHAWFDESTVVGTEWGARLSPSVTAIGRLLAGARSGAQARTAHLAMLQSTPHPRLQVELQVGMPGLGDRGTLTEDASLFDLERPDQRVSVVLRGAID